ncbi:MAG: thymidylate kinase [Candidatus Hodarchaeales archaeon]
MKASKRIQIFIVVDGGDGCGKDTQVRFIVQYYARKGKKVRTRSHPSSDNYFGRQAKRALEEGGKKGHLKAAVFFSLDVIRSLIKYYRHNEGEVLIFSRYLLGVCYLPSSLILFGYNFFSALLPTSEYQFFLDVSPVEARRRIVKRAEKEEMFEKIDRLQKMSRKMRYITSLKGWITIDGDRDPYLVWEDIKEKLVQLDSQH